MTGQVRETYILRTAEIVCTEKRQIFASISSTRYIVVDRIPEFSVHLDRQLKYKNQVIYCIFGSN